MSILCSQFGTAGCGGALSAIPRSYWNGCDQTRSYGANHFILFKCDFNFYDKVGGTGKNIFDKAVWDAAIAAGDIVVSPPGTLTQQAPTQTSTEVEGCRRTIVGDMTYLYDFTTIQTGADCEDFEFWDTLFRSASQYRIAFVHCDGRLDFDEAWYKALKALIDATPGGPWTYPVDGTEPVSSPGFSFGVPVAPYITEQTDLRVEQWTTQFEIKRNPLQDGIIKSLCNMDSVISAITAANP